MTSAQDDVLARLTGFHELRLGVDADHALGCVQIDVQGLPGGYSCIMAPNAALDLAWRLLGACTRLRKGELDQPPAGSPGPFSARY